MIDLLVIGGGPAGMNAAIYGARMGLSVKIIEGGLFGGQMQNTDEIENYIGYKNISGEDLSDEMEEHMMEFLNKEDSIMSFVTSVKKESGVFYVDTEDKGQFEAKTVILATGCTHKKLGINGEETYNSKGVSYCAICDGMFFKGKHVLVVGGGNSAIEEALYLANIVDKVTVVHRRDELRADKIYADKALAHPKINFEWNQVPKEIIGEDKVTGVILESVQTGLIKTIEASGVFIYIGMDPILPSVEGLKLNTDGFVITDDKMNTNIPGLFVVGDLRDKELRQIITAANDGAVAAQSSYNHILNG